MEAHIDEVQRQFEEEEKGSMMVSLTEQEFMAEFNKKGEVCIGGSCGSEENDTRRGLYQTPCGMGHFKTSGLR